MASDKIGLRMAMERVIHHQNLALIIRIWPLPWTKSIQSKRQAMSQKIQTSAISIQISMRRSLLMLNLIVKSCRGMQPPRQKWIIHRSVRVCFKMIPRPRSLHYRYRELNNRNCQWPMLKPVLRRPFPLKLRLYISKITVELSWQKAAGPISSCNLNYTWHSIINLIL